MRSALAEQRKPQIAYLLDPRFPGGTSAAVAAELEIVTTFASVKVFAISSSMFSGETIAPQLNDMLRRLNLPLHWDASEITADIVIFHNPSCLRFQDSFDAQIIARHLIVVTHENFVRPGGAEVFDVAKCLTQIEKRSFAHKRWIAPVSATNRSSVKDWMELQGARAMWSMLEMDWFNICNFELQPSNATPTDRRGRHSRAGFEKFPQRDVMELCFPETSESNVILGADTFIDDATAPAHWTLFPFRGLNLPKYFDMIDFMVYFTAPTCRESFGRVLAEALAAGKIVITDPETARPFDGSVIGAQPKEVDQIIQSYIRDPARYQADVAAGQRSLDKFSPDVFKSTIGNLLTQLKGVCA